MSSSASRKVARAAAAGRNTRARREIPLGFYSVIALLVIVGSLIIGYSRYEKQHPVVVTGPAPAIGSKLTVALGFNHCGTYLPDLAAQLAGTNGGIYALSNGLVQVAPKVASAAGANATLANFAKGYSGLKITASGFSLPAKGTFSASAGCGGAKASLKIFTWSSLLATTPTVVTDPAKVHFSNGEIIAVAIVKAGQTPAKPASAAGLGGSPTTTTTATAVTTTTTASSSTTTAAG